MKSLKRKKSIINNIKSIYSKNIDPNIIFPEIVQLAKNAKKSRFIEKFIWHKGYTLCCKKLISQISSNYNYNNIIAISRILDYCSFDFGEGILKNIYKKENIIFDSKAKFTQSYTLNKSLNSSNIVVIKINILNKNQKTYYLKGYILNNMEILEIRSCSKDNDNNINEYNIAIYSSSLNKTSSLHKKIPSSAKDQEIGNDIDIIMDKLTAFMISLTSDLYDFIINEKI